MTTVHGEGMPVDEETGEDLDGDNEPGEMDVTVPDPNPRHQDTISFEKWEDEEENTFVTLDLSDDEDNIVGIENIIGSAEDDVLTGDDMPNTIEGGDGEDTLDGGEGPGDTVSYRSSDRAVKIDLSDGTPGDRGSRGDAAGDSIDGFENIIGSAHDDDLRGTFVAGTADGNTIEGLADADVLDGGDTDISGDQTLNDLNQLLSVADVAVDDFANASATDNNRSDTLSYRSSSAGVTVNLATASASGGDATGDEIETFDVDYDHDGDGAVDNSDPLDQNPVDVTDTDAVETEFATFENITGSAHRDLLTGDDRMNVIHGGAGDDVIKGGRSNDTLEGGPGADTLDGGHTRTSNLDPSDFYTDTASYSFAAAGVTVDIDAGRGTGGDAMGDRFTSIEQFMGSANDDMFIAGEDPDIINGGAHGADDIVGGGTGLRSIRWRYGILRESEEAVHVDLEEVDGVAVQVMDDATPNAPENPEGSYARGDMLSNVENVMGSSHDDVLIGNDQVNELYGGDGDDTMTAVANDGAGAGPGPDVLVGGAGDDTLTGDATTAATEVLMGGSGHDTISGAGGADRIVGGAGDDVMYGGVEDTPDTVTDTFVFSPADGAGDDVIVDLTNDIDRIDLSAFEFSQRELDDIRMNHITDRGDDVRIDLTDFGGGTILLQGVITKANLDAGGDLTTEGAIDMLDVYNPADTPDDGITDNPDGIFIV